jgi:hypothetical protein
MGAPLSPTEITKRAQIAARAANGALHQDEPVHFISLDPGEPRESGNQGRPVKVGPLPERIEPDISPVDVWVMTETGLRRWRPIIDQLTVTPLPNGERILDIGGHRLRLNEALRRMSRSSCGPPSIGREDEPPRRLSDGLDRCVGLSRLPWPLCRLGGEGMAA